LAKECVAAREKLIREERASFELTKKWANAADKTFARVALSAMEAAECIASDDRRLTP